MEEGITCHVAISGKGSPWPQPEAHARDQYSSPQQPWPILGTERVWEGLWSLYDAPVAIVEAKYMVDMPHNHDHHLQLLGL